MCEVRRDDGFSELAGQLVLTAAEVLERWGSWQSGGAEVDAMGERLKEVQKTAGVMLARVGRLGEEG